MLLNSAALNTAAVNGSAGQVLLAGSISVATSVVSNAVISKLLGAVANVYSYSVGSVTQSIPIAVLGGTGVISNITSASPVITKPLGGLGAGSATAVGANVVAFVVSGVSSVQSATNALLGKQTNLSSSIFTTVATYGTLGYLKALAANTVINAYGSASMALAKWFGGQIVSTTSMAGVPHSFYFGAKTSKQPTLIVKNTSITATVEVLKTGFS